MIVRCCQHVNSDVADDCSVNSDDCSLLLLSVWLAVNSDDCSLLLVWLAVNSDDCSLLSV